MHFKSLKVFCDVVSRRSFSRAAKENGITQSGASQVVHQLEHRLGVQLLDRSRRPFVLTPEGDLYYQRCRKLVHDYLALEEEIRTFHEGVVGLVRVAAIYSAGLTHMNECVQMFLAANPKANVRLEYQHPEKVVELVENDEVELGLVSYPKSTRHVKASEWREEPMVLVCSPRHALASRTEVSLTELNHTSLVGFDRGLRIRREIDRAFHAAGVDVEVVMEFDNIETIKRAIEIDAGAGLLPRPTVTREEKLGTLVSIPLSIDGDRDGKGNGQENTRSGKCRLTRPLGIIQRRGKSLGATARRFMLLLKENAKIGATGENASSGIHSRSSLQQLDDVECVR